MAEKISEALKKIPHNDRKAVRDSRTQSRPASGSNSPRVKFAEAMDIDAHVDLSDIEFQEFFEDAVRQSFMNTWEKENVTSCMDVTDQEKYGPYLKATFMRDFENSTYLFQTEGGESMKLTTLDDFIERLGGKSNPYVTKTVSHIATQNLTLFLKHVLFERCDKQGKHASALCLSDTTPLVPLARFKAEYKISKDHEDKVILDYVCKASPSSIGKMSARIAGSQEHKTYEVSAGAELTISTRITVATDGEWHIANPRVQASGWQLI